MAYLLSPGVNVSEIDLTTTVPQVATTAGAFAGDFVWGPANKIETISNEVELVNMFGTPDANTFTSFFTCANFLAYGQNLNVVRSVNTAITLNATSGANAIGIANGDDYDQSYLQVPNANTYGMFIARYPGSIGNSLKVSIFAASNTNGTTWTDSLWPWADQFNSGPGTSKYATNVNGANDEMHIVVIDEDGKFGGVANAVLEKFEYVSKASDAKNDDGSSNYYVNVLRQKSKYIYSMNHAQAANGLSETTTWGLTASNTNFAQGSTFYTASLANGTFNTATAGVLELGYDHFTNPQVADISLIMTGGHPLAVQQYVIDNLAETRKDCIAFVSPTQANTVYNTGDEATDVVAWRNAIGRSSSYTVMDSTWKYQFDKYNNVYRWVPMNGDIAGLCARTDQQRHEWFSPAGLDRGRIKNVVKLGWNPTQTNRDTLYKNSVNPVVTFPGDGTVLFGDKTMTSKPSAFDRINVRRLFITLEKAISKAARFSLFEFNDEFTRAQFVSLVEPFLRTVKGQRGIYDYKVVCDSTNNTPEIIDSNQFVGDIYIKPARSINFIQLNFIAVRTGVTFQEVVGQF